MSRNAVRYSAQLPTVNLGAGGLDLTGMDGGDRASTPTPDTGTLRTDYTGDSYPRVFKVEWASHAVDKL